MAPRRPRTELDEAVVASVDEFDGIDHLVIADVTIDGAWISLPVDVAIRLREWR